MTILNLSAVWNILQLQHTLIKRNVLKQSRRLRHQRKGCRSPPNVKGLKTWYLAFLLLYMATAEISATSNDQIDFKLQVVHDECEWVRSVR